MLMDQYEQEIEAARDQKMDVKILKPRKPKVTPPLESEGTYISQ